MEAPKNSFDLKAFADDTCRAAEKGELKEVGGKLVFNGEYAQKYLETAKSGAEYVEVKVPFAKRTAQKIEKLTSVDWKELSTGHKVNAGISGACALMSAYGMLSAASNSVAHDVDGKAHVQWSQVGVALLQGAVAAGCAFFTVEALHGRSAF